LLTQRKFAEYVVNREADYHFTVKNNQPTLREDIALFFENRQKPDFIDHTPPDHGRIETRATNLSRDSYQKQRVMNNTLSSLSREREFAHLSN